MAKVVTAYERVERDVLAYVESHPGCLRSEISGVVTGSNGAKTAAVTRLLADGRIVDPWASRGGRGRLYLPGDVKPAAGSTRRVS